MNKKFLNAILFGALILGSAGSITSCKDYDDEIDAINQRITEMTTKSELSSQVATLQTSITAAASQAAEALNQAKAAQQSATAAAQAADKAVADAKAAGDAAVVAAKEAAAKAAAAEVAKAEEAVKAAEAEVAKVAGLQEEVTALKEQLATIKDDASAAAKKEIDEFKEQLQDKMDEIDELKEKLEKAIKKSENTLSEVELVGTIARTGATTWKLTSQNDLNYLYNFYFVNKAAWTAAQTTAYNAWVADGGKKIENGQVLSTVAAEPFLIRVAPASVDASALDFAFVNSSGTKAPMKLYAPSAFTGTLTRATENGLWIMAGETNPADTYRNAAAYSNQFGPAATPTLFALQEADGYTSPFQYSFALNANRPLAPTDVVFYNTDSRDYFTGQGAVVTPAFAVVHALPAAQTILAGAPVAAWGPGSANVSAVEAKIGEEVVPEFVGGLWNTDGTAGFTAAKIAAGITQEYDGATGVYDYHFDFAADLVTRFGIKMTEEGFYVTKTPDTMTIPSFRGTLHWMNMDGTVATQDFVVQVKKTSMADGAFANQNKLVVANAAQNRLTWALTPMFEALGSNLAIWTADVAKVSVSFYGVKNGGMIADPGTTVTFLNNNGAAVNAALTNVANATTVTNAAINTAKSIMLQITNTAAYDLAAQYYAQFAFLDTSNEELTNITVPFTVSIPALSDLLKREQVVFGGTTVGKAYLNAADFAAFPAAGANHSPYAFTHAFNNLANAYTQTANTLTFGIDPTQKINNTTVNGTLAVLTNGTAATTRIHLVETAGGATKQARNVAYNQDIKIVITAANYLGLAGYAYSAAERAENAFTFRIMSPIEQGTIAAAAGAGVTVTATDDGTAVVKESDFNARTYAGVKYDIFLSKYPTAVATTATLYKSEFLAGSGFTSANINNFTVQSVNPATRTFSGATVTSENEGSVTLKPANAGYTATANLNVTVTDIWGYTKSSAIPVTINPNN